MIFFIGCDTYYMICSLNPFYLEKNITLSPEIEGSWFAKPLKSLKDSANSPDSKIWGVADTTSTWSIKRHISKVVVKSKKGEDSTTYKPENYYNAKLLSQTESGRYEFKVVVFKVKNGLYADFIPIAKEELIKSKLSSGSFFEVHTLSRITLTGNQMNISWLGADCVKEMIEKKRVRVNYQWVPETGRFLLTASSHDLNGMIERYGDHPRFIDWEAQQARMNLTRLN
jgi:hypothetical protein